MKINKFEDIKGWIKAKELTLSVYRTFGSKRDFSFKDQIQKASVSIMNNMLRDLNVKQIKNSSNSFTLPKVL